MEQTLNNIFCWGKLGKGTAAQSISNQSCRWEAHTMFHEVDWCRADLPKRVQRDSIGGTLTTIILIPYFVCGRAVPKVSWTKENHVAPGINHQITGQSFPTSFPGKSCTERLTFDFRACRPSHPSTAYLRIWKLVLENIPLSKSKTGNMQPWLACRVSHWCLHTD